MGTDYDKAGMSSRRWPPCVQGDDVVNRTQPLSNSPLPTSRKAECGDLKLSNSRISGRRTRLRCVHLLTKVEPRSHPCRHDCGGCEHCPCRCFRELQDADTQQHGAETAIASTQSSPCARLLSVSIQQNDGTNLIFDIQIAYASAIRSSQSVVEPSIGGWRSDSSVVDADAAGTTE